MAGYLVSKRQCEFCGHRADYHHQPGEHPCGICDCKALRVAELKKPKAIGWAVTRDKHQVRIFEAGITALVCFGCGEHIAPGEQFCKRSYYMSSYRTSTNAVPFCGPCMPVTAEGLE